MTDLATRRARWLSLFAATLTIIVSGAVLLPAGLHAAADSTTEGEVVYSATGAEQTFDVPAGVRHVQVTAIGGKGGSSPIHGPAGGEAAKVTDPSLEVTPGDVLWVEVGGDGEGTEGGFNGGGSATPYSGQAAGGGGGGATDLRTVARGEGGTLDSRLLVAAGGGGGGATANGSGGTAGGKGGKAGEAGSTATTHGFATGGGGGGAGGASAGGTAGAASQESVNGDHGSAGGAGQKGQGGGGGAGPSNSPPGWGGGGGGGLYGGGGGGGGADNSAGDGAATGGGGGGGGSSLVPTDASMETTAAAPSLAIAYTIPGTEISSGPPPVGKETTATFQVVSTQPESTFECQLDEGGFAPCDPEYTAAELADGDHVFEARAINSEDNFDPTPATVRFTVDTVDPSVSIDGGPSGTTTEPRPLFTFSSDESGASFRCAFDSDQLGACSGKGTDMPSADLAAGPHTFTVEAIDAAGNVSAPASRSFTVAIPTPGASSGSASVKILKVAGNSKKGTATLTVQASGPGKVSLAPKKGLSAAPRQTTGQAPVKLVVKPSGAVDRQLRKKGKAKVRIEVVFAPTSGASVSAGRTLKLRWALPLGKGR